MKILHVIGDLKPSSGGPPKAVIEMCTGLVREGHEVSIYTTDIADSGRLDVPTEKPVRINGVNIHYFSYGPIRKYTVSFTLAKALKRDIPNFDIVHIHSVYLFHTSVAAYYCRKYQVPYLIRPHGSMDPYLRNHQKLKKVLYINLIERNNLNQAAAVHYTATDEKILAHDQLRLTSPVVIIPLGVDLSEFEDLPKAGSFKEAYPELKNNRIILFLGRITVKKGLDLLARSFAEIKKSHPDTRLVIVGPEDPGFGDQVREWLRENGILKFTTFTGLLRGKEKLAAYVDADLFILPSYTENFGITLVEAMACGVPVITTNKVNTWREIQEAGTGIITHCDASELRDAMVQLLDASDLRGVMGEKGRKLVKEKFSQRNIATNLVDAYTKILSGKLN